MAAVRLHKSSTSQYDVDSRTSLFTISCLKILVYCASEIRVPVDVGAI